MRSRAALAAVALASAGGCLQSTSSTAGLGGDQQACNSCKHTNAGGVGGGGSNGSSKGGGSTGGGSSGGSVGGSSGGGSSSGGGVADGGEVTCASILAFATPVTCASGSVDLSSQLVDFLECTVVTGGTVEALDPQGIPYPQASAQSGSDGTFSLCLPQQSPFTLQASAAQYPTTYFGELNGLSTEYLGQLGLIASSFISAFGSATPDGIDPNKGLLIVKVNASSACKPARTGWTIGISLPDGGSFPDGGYELGYLASSGLPTLGLDATTNSGAALFYNIDPSLTDFVLISYSNPDAGAACQSVNDAYGFTGRAYVAGNAATVFPILLP